MLQWHFVLLPVTEHSLVVLKHILGIHIELISLSFDLFTGSDRCSWGCLSTLVLASVSAALGRRGSVTAASILRPALVAGLAAASLDVFR